MRFCGFGSRGLQLFGLGLEEIRLLNDDRRADVQNVDALHNDAQANHHHRLQIENVAVKENIQAADQIQKSDDQMIVEVMLAFFDSFPGAYKIADACRNNP